MQCSLAITMFISHGASACQQGETVQARWIDGTFKMATIVEVRDGPDGTCGQYKLSWRHTRICEDSTNEYWGDGSQAQAFCFVSRDSLRECKRELCRVAGPVAAPNQNSKPSKEEKSVENSSVSHFGKIAVIALSCLGLAACCVCARISLHLFCPQCVETDEEKATDAISPFSRGGDLWSRSPAKIPRSPAARNLWARSPSSKVSKSPIARWMDKTRKTAWPSNERGIKIVARPAPVAAVVVAEKHAQPERWIGDRHGSACPEDLRGCQQSSSQTHVATLRQAAQVYVPPARVYAPPPQPWRDSATVVAVPHSVETR